MNWHMLSIAKVYELLGTGSKGLSSETAQEKLLLNGPNELQEGKKKNVLNILLAQFKEVMILILLAAAVISGIIGELTDTIVIFLIVILNAIIGFIQEYRAEKAMLALKQMAVSEAKVLRDGIIHWITSTEVVPGDIVLLDAGNAVPADIRLTESFNLTMDEAALTGESSTEGKITAAME